MFQRDYIMRLIEESAKVLAKILGLRNEKDYSKAHEEIENTFHSLLKIESEKIASCHEDDLIPLLVDNEKFELEKLEIVAKFLFVKAEIQLDEEKLEESKKNFIKALNLFKYVDKELKIYSYDRIQSITDIQNILYQF